MTLPDWWEWELEISSHCVKRMDGRPIGIEIAIPALVTVEAVNQILTSYELEPVDSVDLSPLRHAA